MELVVLIVLPLLFLTVVVGLMMMKSELETERQQEDK